jgi:hypothetical protein
MMTGTVWRDGMRSASVRTRRRTLISVAVTVAALGWAPAQALAADGPVEGSLGSAAETTSASTDLVDPVQGTVNQAADTVSSAADTLSDPLPDPVDQVVDTTTDTVAGVSGTASGVVDPVTDATSATVDAVSDATSGTTDAVAGSATDAVGEVTDALGTTTSGLSGSGSPTGVSVGDDPGASSPGSSVRTGSTSSSIAMDSRHSGAVLLEAREGTDPASDVGSPAEDSLAAAVADILRKLLAFTGWGALTWIAVALGLSIVGAAAVYHGGRRPRYSGSASSS